MDLRSLTVNRPVDTGQSGVDYRLGEEHQVMSAGDAGLLPVEQVPHQPPSSEGDVLHTGGSEWHDQGAGEHLFQFDQSDQSGLTHSFNPHTYYMSANPEPIRNITVLNVISSCAPSKSQPSDPTKVDSSIHDQSFAVRWKVKFDTEPGTYRELEHIWEWELPAIDPSINRRGIITLKATVCVGPGDFDGIPPEGAVVYLNRPQSTSQWLATMPESAREDPLHTDIDAMQALDIDSPGYSTYQQSFSLEGTLLVYYKVNSGLRPIFYHKTLFYELSVYRPDRFKVRKSIFMGRKS